MAKPSAQPPPGGPADARVAAQVAPAPERDIWPRAVLLAAWAAAADLWLERHLGFGISDPVKLLGLTGALTVGSLVLDWFVPKQASEALRERWFARLRAFLGRPWMRYLLVLLYLGGGILAATYSSLTLTGGPKAAAVVDLAGRQVAKFADVAAPAQRLLLSTNPFGRNLRVQVQGYLPQTLTLYPLFGSTIDPERDLQPLPTLLFRPTSEALDSLGNQGEFILYKIQGDTCRELVHTVGKESRRAFLLGGQQPPPASGPALWALELQAQGLTSRDAANVLLAWSQAEFVATEPIEPGARIYALVTTQAGNPKAAAEAIVGRAPWQDVRMQSTNADRCKQAP